MGDQVRAEKLTADDLSPALLLCPLDHCNISLTLALMGSDDMNLRVLSTSSDDPKERKAATKVLKLLQRGRHWVLVVLLLGNVVRLFIHPTAICSMLVKAYR